MKYYTFYSVFTCFLTVCLYYTRGIPIHPNAYEHLIAPKISQHGYKNYQKSNKQNNKTFQKKLSSSRYQQLYVAQPLSGSSSDNDAKVYVPRRISSNTYRKKVITNPRVLPKVNSKKDKFSTTQAKTHEQHVHVYLHDTSNLSNGINVTVKGGGIIKPKVTAVLNRERPNHNIKPPLVKNTSSIDEVATVRKQNRKQQWIHSAKRVVNKSRKTLQPTTLDKTDNLIVSMPKMKEKVRALHQALNSHRQRSRSEHKRIWKDISKTKNDVRKVLKTIVSIKKNNTDFAEGLKRYTKDYNKHRNDVLFRIEDIEKHQKKQDLRFFNGFESTQNNSVDIAELKAQVQTLADKLEFMEHQNMISDNKTLLKMVEKSKHLKGAVNSQLEPLRTLSKEEVQESPIFIEPGDYHMIEEDYHDFIRNQDEVLITQTTVEKSQLTDVIGSQAVVIKNQNKTISSLVDRILKQDKMMHNMMEDLEYQQESTNKLMNIVTSLGQQMRGPVMQYKDCHDLWLAGHAESGVYSIVRGMEMQPVFCNMTLYGGWTVIQRRMDGTQDFDRDWKDYSKGFGSVYGEYWLGLETIRWLTHSRIYKVAFIITDWNDKKRIVNYDQFLVYGQEYVLSVKGFSGNEKDDMISASNGMPFRVRHQDRSTSINANAGCTATRRSGWWFPPNCGQANPNGPYTMSVLAPVEDQAVDYNLKGKTSQPPMVRWLTWCDVTDFLKSITIQIMPSQSMEAVVEGLIESTGGLDSVKIPIDAVSIVDQN